MTKELALSLAPTISRRAPTLEQHPSSVGTPTLILKETVQQQRVLLNPDHPLLRILPYAELLTCHCNHCLHPLHPDQLLLNELVWDFINLRWEVLQERLETGEYIDPGGI